MIEIRIAERAHEKMIGENVVLRPLPHRQLRAVVVAHRQAARVRHFREPIVAAVVDLLLLLIELVDQVARRRRQRQIDRRRVDPEWLVR